MTHSAAGGAPIRIAMWSGPRNLSTAMMRAFGNRPDCAVVDEPFYAAFLRLSGVKHPMRDDVLSHYETDWRKVAKSLLGPVPGGKPLFYQKHMTHHMLPEIGRDWMQSCRHAFLIRHPARVLASYVEKREAVSLNNIGFLQQAELFDQAANLMGGAPPVIDAEAVLADPRQALTQLCRSLGIGFTEEMLKWQPGPRETDGIWGKYWYDAVNRSSGFAPPRPLPSLHDPKLRAVEEKALPIYERLAAYSAT